MGLQATVRGDLFVAVEIRNRMGDRCLLSVHDSPNEPPVTIPIEEGAEQCCFQPPFLFERRGGNFHNTCISPWRCEYVVAGYRY